MALFFQCVAPLLAFLLLDSVAAQSCRSGWVGNRDSCYKFVARGLTVKGLAWEDAEIKCQSFGGHLVSIANQVEQNFIRSKTSKFVNEHFWIGYNDRANESYFNWTDGLTGTNFTNWRKGEPNDFLKREDCVELVARSGLWNDEYCANEYSYICKRSLGAPVPTQGPVIPTATSAPIYCGAGWNSYGTSCYRFSTVVKTWTEAMKDCRESGSYLVKVDNSDEQHYLSYRLRMLSQPMWIGLNDRAVEGTYVWVGDKSPVNYTNWFPGEPNDFSGNEDCIQILNGYWGGFWNDNFCGKTRTYICEKPYGKNLCPANWVPFGDSCLQFNTHPAQALTWSKARDSCRITKGAELISIHSQDEQTLLLQMLNDLRASNIWLGLNDIVKEGLFVWNDRSTVDYKNWSPNEPGNDAAAANKDCAVLVTSTDNGTWATTNCSYMRTYVCRRNRGYDQCNSPLGMENLQIADSQITASSYKDSGSIPSQARLKLQPSSSTLGAWCAKNTKKGEYLQIDLGLIRQMTHIAVQGRPKSSDFVKTFYLRYGNDGQTFINYGNNATQSYQILTGSNTSDAIVNIMLSGTINCRFIRIYPLSWSNALCMRTEIYGCEGQATSSKCKSGWEEGPDNTCYQFNTNQLKIWADARATCTSQDGDLLSIVTNNERIYIDNRLKSLVNSVGSLWIGLNDRQSNRLFYWSDHSPYVVTRWDSGYPKDTTNGKSCVELVPSRAAWRDVACGQYKPFICKKKLSSPHSKKYPVTGYWISATDAYWPLDSLVNGKALGTTPAQVSGNVTKANVRQNTKSVLQFASYNSYLTAGDYPNQCIGDADACNAGLSVSLIVNLDAPTSTWGSRKFLVDSIGDTTWATSRGFAIYVEQMQIKVMLMTTTTSWSVSAPITRGAWHHVVFTWIPSGAGLILYIDSKPKGSDTSGTTLIPTHGTTNNVALTIGSKSSGKTQGVFFMRSLAFWYRALDPSEITDIFLSEFGKCRLGWKEHGQYCYQFNNNKRNWPSARTQCQNQGGDLVSITSPVEQAHISMEVSYFGLSTFAWIGFHDRTSESVWEWSDGSAARFSNWYKYQPDNWYWHGEDCAHTYHEFYRVGRWNDIACGTNMAYICKRKKEYSPSGVVTPTMVPRRVIICEWTSDILSCPTSTVISVQSATYGRTDPGLCGKISVTNCRLNVTQRVRGMCDGLAFCSVRPTNALMGKDPCRTVRKYLDVTYLCKKGPVKTPDCPDGWLRDPSGAACFGLMLEKKTWFEARDSCKRYGAVLTTINFELVNSLVTSLMVQSWDAGDIWIGFNDIGQRGVYRWLDNKPIRYTNWWNGEPNDRNSNGSCVRATMTSSITDKMYWVDSDCNLKLAYVCYKFRRNVTKPTPAPTVIPTTPCPTGWKAYKMGCYRLFTQTKTWTAARDSCRAYRNTALISIHDTAESVFVQGLLNKTVNAWIGLNDRGPIAGHVWVDRTPVDFTKWGPLQPDSHSGQQPCVVVTGTGYWSDVGCYSTRPYICKMKRPSSPLTTVRPTVAPSGPPVPPGTCDRGWRYWRQMCYHFSNQTLSNLRSWFDARTTCKQAGGDLASVLSASENAYIYSVFRKEYRYVGMWIGLSDLGTEGSYEWSDGSPVWYTNYGWREPSNYKGQEDCIHFWKWSGRWNDNLCNKRYPFVCKKHNNTYTPPPTIAPTPGPAVGRCNPGWIHYDKRCYKFIGYETQTWLNAKAMCEKGTNDSTYGDLVSINNQYEQAFISTMMRADYKYKNGFWIGLNDLHTEGLFSWVNNDQVTYTNWNTMQPIRNWRLDCVDLVPGNPGMGRWRVRPCTYRQSYICETAALPLGPTSATPTPSPDCPAQFTKYGDACYSMFYTKLTWKEAREVCSKYENGDVISIHSSYEQAFLLRNMINFPGDVWTGLSREPNSLEFTWSDRSVKEYTHWSRGQPGQPGSKKTCVQSSNAANNDGRWMEVDCNKKNGFMCRIYKGEPHVTPILQGTCLPGYKKYDKFCYLFRLYDKRSWSEARFRCNKAGGDLVSILNQQEKDFLSYQTKELRWPIFLWTGLNDRTVESGYHWSDGSPVSFVSWAWRQPDDKSGRQNCVGFNTMHGKWYDVGCSWRLGYICKAKLECSLPLGMASYNITNAQLTASSQLNPAHSPGMGRINGSSGWCANASTKGQYFEVDFRNQMEITKISIKGIPFLTTMSAFIRSFTVSYATYKNQWQLYKVNGATRVFSANWDSKTVVTLAVDPAIPARFLRVQPQTWAFSVCAQFEFYGCAFECRKPMGIGSGLISDKLINASSQLDAQHGALQARPTSGIGWCPKTTDKNPWLQVTWPAFAKRLTKLATWGVGAGRGGGYVTKYKLAFSDNGYVWTDYSEKRLVRIFRGNVDPVSPLVHVLAEPIKTQYFRLLPLAGSTGGKCLRFELYGCASGCNDALGMGQGTIEDSWLTASSFLDAQHNPTMARLNGVSGWCASSNDKEQYLQIDLGRMYRIRQVATQGSQDGKGFVKTYYLRTYLKIWQYYVFKDSKTLVANADATSVVVTTFYSPRRARLVQILPQSWSTRICMRVEIYGCIPNVIDKPTVQPIVTTEPTGSPLPTTPPQDLSFDVKMKLTTVPWKDTYSDRTSTDFNNLANKIITEVTSLYNKGKNDMPSLAFRYVKIVSFKEGSVVVNFNITFFADIAQGIDVTQRIKDSATNGSIGNLKVDPESLTITKIDQSGGKTSAQKKGPGSGLSTGAKAAIGVVVVLVILSGLLLLGWFLRKKYKSGDHNILKHETFNNPIHFSSQEDDMEG